VVTNAPIQPLLPAGENSPKQLNCASTRNGTSGMRTIDSGHEQSTKHLSAARRAK